MKHKWILLIVGALPILSWAQDQQQPAAPAPFTPAVPQASMVAGYGGFPGYSTGGSTVAGDAMHGMASVISARGDAALSASAAAVNLTQADKQLIQNQYAATDTYFQMRATNRAARAAERGSALSMEQLAKIAHDGVPKPLSASQLDPVSGHLNWPGPLQHDAFAAHRAELDQLMTQQAHYGTLSYADQTKVRSSVNAMFKALKANIKQIPAPDYTSARSFLNSVLYAATKSQLG
jgi:hypothetical protein